MAFTRRTAGLLLLVIVSLIAASCGGTATAADRDVREPDDQSGSVEAGNQADPAEDVAAESPTAVASTAEESSPLAELLGVPFGDEDQDAYLQDLNRQAEVKIAECMRSQGFEYQPVDYSSITSAAPDVDFDSRAFAEEYGFGITSNPFEQLFDTGEGFSDPNQAYVSSLSDGEREAYETALSGQLPDEATSIEGGFATYEPGGCLGDAFDEVHKIGAVFDQFASAFEELDAAFEADPRIVQATAGWSQCMAEAGHRLSDEESAVEDIQRRYDAIVNDPEALDFDAFDTGEGTSDSGEDDIGTFIVGALPLKPEFQARVDQLGVTEREIAVASWDCNGELREIEADVRREYEQRFVDTNADAIRAALGE